MKTRVIIGLCALAALTFLFQNCGQVSFLKANADGALVAGATDGTAGPSPTPSVDPSPTPEPSATPDPGPSATPVPPNNPNPSPTPKEPNIPNEPPTNPTPSATPSTPNEPPTNPPHEPKGPKDPGAGSNNEVECIIQNHGKSTHVQYQADALSTGTGNKQTVCMSVNACENLVSEIFDVVGVNHEAVCAHNPNVVHMSDTDVAALVTKQKSP